MLDQTRILAPPAAAGRRPGSFAGAIRGRLRGRLYRKFATLLVALVATALIVVTGFEAYNSYLENRASLAAIQREKAQGAAAVIEQFLREIEGQLGWTTHAAVLDSQGGTDQRRLDFLRLLRQAPAITEVSHVDQQGREQLRVSRLAMDVVSSGTDRSGEIAVREAIASRRYMSEVYFRKESEPYLTLAITGASRRAGVTVAEVNLKFIWDVISRIKVGRSGIAYAVDDRGLLIAHPDIGLVLRKTDLSGLDQVRATAPAGRAGAPPEIARDRLGRHVLTAQANVEPMGWRVFVEQPLEDAFEPIYASLRRTGILSLLGLVIAGLLGLWLAQRLVVPIEALAVGAARIGAGDLGHRISVKTGDEVEALAESFNEMGGRLKESYAGLERKVEERTAELARSVSELRALGEVGQAVSSSLDLQTVLGTILSHACALADAGGGTIYVLDEDSDQLSLAASHNMSEAFIAELRDCVMRLSDSMSARSIAGGHSVQIGDIRETPDHPIHDILSANGIRALLGVPLRHQERTTGILFMGREAPGLFAPETVSLLEAFASQSSIAINNARLFREIEEKSEQLRVASLHKSQFLANMSHELRTPLNAILGYTELIQDGVYGEVEPKLGTILGRVQSNGRHLLGLINDVLDLSKIEAGQLVLRLEPYSMRDLVQAVLSATEALAAEKKLTLAAEIAPDLAPGMGDAQRITQVLLNLVGNAIKFTDTGGVTISARQRGAKFILKVSDTGPGIPAEEQGRIFEEFHQVDSSNTKKKGGTGLGLAISLRIVAMHGGRISVESRPGEGATFRVDLPIRVEKQRGI